VGPECSKLLFIAWSFQWPFPSWSCPQPLNLMRTKDVPVIQKIPRDLGPLCQKLGSKTKIIRTNSAPGTLSLWELQEF
jgi:hypothetical protein